MNAQASPGVTLSFATELLEDNETHRRSGAGFARTSDGGFSEVFYEFVSKIPLLAWALYGFFS
jgi:hypothetical protein